MGNSVFIGTSLDGYIADRNGGLGFLETVPNPKEIDLGFVPFMERMDAVLMGRATFETVLGFGGQWPYPKPVFVLSTTMTSIPKGMEDKAEIVNGSLQDIVSALNKRGYEDLYIDGGKVIQSFLAEDMIDELIVTRVPVLLGGGTPLYGSLPEHLEFELVKSEVMLGAMVQSHYRRTRK